jgi:hypothetical protein
VSTLKGKHFVSIDQLRCVCVFVFDNDNNFCYEKRVNKSYCRRVASVNGMGCVYILHAYLHFIFSTFLLTQQR